MKELYQKTQGAPCCELGCQRHMTTYTLFQHIKRILCARLYAQKQRSPALHELVYNSTEKISGGPRVFKENCFKSLKELLSSLEGLWNTDQQSRAHREPGFPRVDFWRCCVLNPHLQCLCTPHLRSLWQNRGRIHLQRTGNQQKRKWRIQLPTAPCSRDLFSSKATQENTKGPEYNGFQRDAGLAGILSFKRTGAISWQARRPNRIRRRLWKKRPLGGTVAPGSRGRLLHTPRGHGDAAAA